MALSICTKCGTEIAARTSACPSCGKAVEAPDDAPPIRKLSGKFQAAGVLILASAIVATVAGTWWGPAMAFPGVALLLLGRL
ncbi:MAG: hypothetical protein PHT19_03895 [Methylococcus sp.]|nr:hypothetical protein [Methylococcus sp.]